MNSYISDLLSYLKGGAGTVAIDSAMTIAGGTAWHSGNDGAGSGLDADLHDGLQTGNGSGNVPINNGTQNANLNAEIWAGYRVARANQTGSYQLPNAATPTIAFVRANGGTLAVSSVSGAIIVGGTNYGTGGFTAAANDSYTFIADGSTWTVY